MRLFQLSQCLTGPHVVVAPGLPEEAGFARVGGAYLAVALETVRPGNPLRKSSIRHNIGNKVKV